MNPQTNSQNSTVGRIGLKDAIAALRMELVESIEEAKKANEAVQFEVGEITMEFQVEVERDKNFQGGFKFWVVELGAGASVKDKTVHTVTIPLKVVGSDGITSVHVNSNADNLAED